jgi:DNA-binding NarL/FixJ family response regulator
VSQAALAAGMAAVVRRDAAPAQIAAATVAVAQGLVAYAPELLPQVARAAPVAGSEVLTPRETEVLALLAEGLSNKQIAVRLDLSEHTAKFHVTAIISKLGAQSRTDAVVRGARLGLLML